MLLYPPHLESEAVEAFKKFHPWDSVKKADNSSKCQVVCLTRRNKETNGLVACAKSTMFFVSNTKNYRICYGCMPIFTPQLRRVTEYKRILQMNKTYENGICVGIACGKKRNLLKNRLCWECETNYILEKVGILEGHRQDSDDDISVRTRDY